jgi:hemolysin activation/secretion protein
MSGFRRASIDVYASFEYKQIEDSALHHRTLDDRLRVLGLGTDFGFKDGWHGNNFINFTYYRGIPDFLGGSPAVSKHSSRKGAGGKFSILNLDYKRMQQFFTDFFFLINFSGQYSFNNATPLTVLALPDLPPYPFPRALSQ